ncbi:hypothetical protein ABEB36_005981 [Hypothenemus hampei]|uniref:Uncharacterized protein n=1 Tax=Hypothenemus hampei TaxID=57062 RepID=A0ABD1F0Q9_HYPHA
MDLMTILKTKINGEIVNPKIDSLTANGKNYGSLMLKVDVKVGYLNKEEAIEEVFNTKVTFKTEIAWYTDIIPLYHNFLEENGIENILECFPKVYGSIVDADGILLLENLAAKGYANKNRLEGFNLKISREILARLAKFNASGLAMKIKTSRF